MRGRETRQTKEKGMKRKEGRVAAMAEKRRERERGREKRWREDWSLL